MIKLRAFIAKKNATVFPLPAPCCTPIKSVKRYSEFGVPKIQRPASSYTDYVAANTGTYVLQSNVDSCSAKALTAYAICSCASSDVIKHTAICIKCRYDNRDGPTNT
jgi:hypothetical protein